MNKSKIFVTNHYKELEGEINDWMKDNAVFITDVNYTMAFNLENNEMYYSAFLLYEDYERK